MTIVLALVSGFLVGVAATIAYALIGFEADDLRKRDAHRSSKKYPDLIG